MTAHPTTVHPSAVLGPGVELGVGVSIGPCAVVLGPTRIGDRVWIGAGASIGAPPEITSLRHNLAWAGDLDHAGVEIHDDAVVRELAVVHQGSDRPTVVGAASWLLNRAYVAHDVELGRGVILSAGVSVGGRCTIRDGANVGMNTSVHQNRRIGARAMIGMGSAVTRDVPPYAKAFGVPLRLHGVNRVGMERAGIDPATIALVRDAIASEVADIDPGAPIAAEVAAEFSWWRTLEDRMPAVDAGRSRAGRR